MYCFVGPGNPKYWVAHVKTHMIFIFVTVEMAGQPGVQALPPALAYLASLDQLIIKQKKEMLESKTV